MLRHHNNKSLGSDGGVSELISELTKPYLAFKLLAGAQKAQKHRQRIRHEKKKKKSRRGMLCYKDGVLPTHQWCYITLHYVMHVCITL